MGQITSVSVINDDLRPDYTVFPSGISISGHIKKYATYKEMKEDRNPPKYGWVEDASGDNTVATGSALYYNKVGNVWVKIYETEMVDNFDDLLTKVFWSEIIGKPESAPTDIDLTVENSHVHNNSMILVALGETNDHILTYKGNIVGWQQEVIDNINSSISVVKNDISTLSIRIGNNASDITTLNEFKVDQIVHNNYSDTRLSTLESIQAQANSDIVNLQIADSTINQYITSLRDQYDILSSKAAENGNKILNLASENIDIKRSITTIDTRVEDIESNINSFNVSIRDLVNWKKDLVDNHRIGTFALRIANLESWRFTIDGYNLENISNHVISLLSDTADIKDKTAVLKSRVDSIQLKVDDFVVRIGTLEDVSADHASRLVNISTSITNINTTLAGKATISVTNELRKDVDDLLTWKLIVDEQLEKGLAANIIIRLNTAESNITSLKNRASAIEEKNEWYDDKLSEHDTTITGIIRAHNELNIAVENHIKDSSSEHEIINDKLDVLESDVVILKSNDVAMDTQIMQHTSKITKIEDNISVNNATLSEHSIELSNQTTTLTQHDIRLTDLEKRASTLEQNTKYSVDIEVLIQQVKANTEDIAMLKEQILGIKDLVTEVDGMI